MYFVSGRGKLSQLAIVTFNFNNNNSIMLPKDLLIDQCLMPTSVFQLYLVVATKSSNQKLPMQLNLIMIKIRLIQWKKPVLATSLRVQNRQDHVCFVCFKRWNQQRFHTFGASLKVQFKQNFSLFRVLLREVSLYMYLNFG